MTRTASPTSLGYQRKTPLVQSDGPFHIPRVGPSGPIAVMEGPLVFGLGAVLDRRWWVWDPNSYFADLGVGPEADRSELRRAYVRLGGSASVRLTFVLAQLLDAGVRAVYESLPAGQIYVDAEVIAARKRRSTLVPDDRPVAERLASPDPDEGLDTETQEAQNRVDTPRPEGVRLGWEWGYWVWDAPAHTPTLRQWQACLCRVFAGSPISCSVGISAPRGLGAFWSLHSNHLIAFIESDQSPSDELARSLQASVPVVPSHSSSIRTLPSDFPTVTDSSDYSSSHPVDPIDINSHQGEPMSTTAANMAARGFQTGVANAKTEPFVQSDRIGPFSIKSEELVYVQFFTEVDELISPLVHPAVPVKAAPPDWTGNWPSAMSAVCRNTPMADNLPLYSEPCWICENLVPANKRFRARKRTFGLGLRRSEIIGDGTPALGGPEKKGQRVGFGIVKVEVAKRDEHGQVTTEKELRDRIEYFAMGWQNFWQGLDGASHILPTRSITKTIFAIRRTGSDLDTSYTILPVREASKDLSDPEVASTYGIEVTVNPDGSKTKKYPPHLDVGQIILNQASDEYYDRFFIPARGPAGTPAPVMTASGEATSTMDQLAALQARLAASVVPAGASPAPAPTSAPGAPSAPAGAELDLDG